MAQATAGVAIGTSAGRREPGLAGVLATARQVGGAIGVAVMATILTSQPMGVDAFADVFLFCCGAALLAALVAARMRA